MINYDTMPQFNVNISFMPLELYACGACCVSISPAPEWGEFCVIKGACDGDLLEPELFCSDLFESESK